MMSRLPIFLALGVNILFYDFHCFYICLEMAEPVTGPCFLVGVELLGKTLSRMKLE